MTEETWYQHPSFRQDLEALLKTPVLQHALQIVRDKLVKATLMPNAPCDLVQFFALMGARRDGCIDVFINLENLSKPKQTEQPLPKPWDTPRDKKSQT